jgi:hypothetical protein
VEKERYSDQMMVQYLLGSFSEEETENVEELSFVDNEFAVRLSAVENDLIDNYVKGKLSGEKHERFNSHYLASPRRRKKVKTAQVFHIYAENAVATGQVVFVPDSYQTIAKSAKPSPQSTFLPGLFTFPHLILAAAILVLVGTVWLIFELSRLRSQVDQAQAARIALEQREKELQGVLEQQRMATTAIEKEWERMRKEKERVERQIALERQIAESQSPTLPANIVPFRLVALARTADQVPTITVPSRTDYVVLQVELEPDDYPGYNAVLLSPPGKKPVGWKGERLKSKVLGDSKAIEVIIPATILKSQEYLLAVTGISGRGVAEGERGYPFRVVKQ